MKSYQDTIDYLYNRLPQFSKIGASAIKKDLTNIKKLCEVLGNPQKKFKSIHVAGTNGKGSTSHMLAATLQTAGYKTGLYTSPHLLDFRERIRINGEMISQEDVVDFVTNNKALIEKTQPSFFEVTVALAFDYFAKQQVDIAVIEVGLGGRLDSTNIIMPILSVITNISLDHVSILGNTIEEIAQEKGGIIKTNTPVIIGEKDAVTAPIFKKIAQEKHSNITFITDKIKTEIVENGKDYLKVKVQDKDANKSTETYQLDLTGSYQQKNLAGVLGAIAELKLLGYSISRNQTLYALAHVKELTNLQGRWQKLNEKPLILCDTGHNKRGWEEIVSNLKQQNYQQLHMVIGAMADKDIESLLTILPKKAIYYFCKPNFERALDEQVLTSKALEKGLISKAYSSIEQAIVAAKKDAQENDLIFIGGSSFVVAEALEYFI